MAQTATLYRFHIDLSDIDRGHYDQLDLRVAMHPSEIPAFLVSRVIAFALNAERGLEFSPGGLSDTDAPCIRGMTDNGTLQTWIEIGNPSARKLNKAAKAARVVKVYTYKDAGALIAEMKSEKIHRVQEIPVYSLSQKFLDQIAATLDRKNDWSVLYHDENLTVTTSGGSFETTLHPQFAV
jgi:uncharacterized protein YaeQ